ESAWLPDGATAGGEAPAAVHRVEVRDRRARANAGTRPLQLLYSAGLLAILACSPGELVQPDDLHFSVSGAPASGSLPRVEASARPGAVDIAGAVRGNLCSSLVQPEARRERHELTLTILIEPRRNATGCQFTAQMILYTLTVENVPPGRFEVRTFKISQLTETPAPAGVATVEVP